MWTHDVDELRQFQSKFDSQTIWIVTDGPDETIVVGQKILVKPLGILIGRNWTADRDEDEQWRQNQLGKSRPPEEQTTTSTITTRIERKSSCCSAG